MRDIKVRFFICYWFKKNHASVTLNFILYLNLFKNFPKQTATSLNNRNINWSKKKNNDCYNSSIMLLCLSITGKLWSWSSSLYSHNFYTAISHNYGNTHWIPQNRNWQKGSKSTYYNPQAWPFHPAELSILVSCIQHCYDKISLLSFELRVLVFIETFSNFLTSSTLLPTPLLWN